MCTKPVEALHRRLGAFFLEEVEISPSKSTPSSRLSKTTLGWKSNTASETRVSGARLRGCFCNMGALPTLSTTLN